MRNCIMLETTPSTNDYAKKNFRTLKHRTVIIAREQTAGRGRFQRSWHSPKGEALYCSIILKKSIKTNQLSLLNLIASLTVLKTIQQYTHITPHLKWPNDVYLNKKKIAGILIESIFKMNTLEGVIIGIGVNINNKVFTDDLRMKATSLYIETGNEIDIDAFLDVLLHTFYAHLRKRKNVAALMKEWSSYSPSLYNTSIMLTINGTLSKGFTYGLSEHGCLLVKKENGTCVELTTSDFFFPE